MGNTRRTRREWQPAIALLVEFGACPAGATTLRYAEKMTKTQLRKRWADPAFVEQLKIPRDRIPVASELQNLDLRGVTKLANGDPLWHFQIHSAEASSIDFSYGDGCVGVYGSSVAKLKFEEFKFDRATSFLRSSFTDCQFDRAHLRLSAKDCEFANCSFDLSTFAGGYSEYGFTRCTFTNCSFRSARWKGTYFKACMFDGCDLTQFQVIDSLVTSIKHRGCTNFTEDIFTGGDVRSINILA
jgi:uncharacterized protein YjbI with pentapeptide repeats